MKMKGGIITLVLLGLLGFVKCQGLGCSPFGGSCPSGETCVSVGPSTFECRPSVWISGVAAPAGGTNGTAGPPAPPPAPVPAPGSSTGGGNGTSTSGQNVAGPITIPGWGIGIGAGTGQGNNGGSGGAEPAAGANGPTKPEVLSPLDLKIQQYMSFHSYYEISKLEGNLLPTVMAPVITPPPAKSAGGIPIFGGFKSLPPPVPGAPAPPLIFVTPPAPTTTPPPPTTTPVPINCQSNPCMNGGNCTDDPVTGGYACQCDEVFYGPQCEGFDACGVKSCFKGGCVQDNSAVTWLCECDMGWSGLLCDNYTACDSNPCQAGGICSYIEPEKIGCDCPLGYEGEFCEVWKGCEIVRCGSGHRCKQRNKTAKCVKR